MFFKKRQYLLLLNFSFTFSLEPKPKLLVASRYYIREMGFNGENIQVVTDGVENVVAIDYDWVDHYIYWSDITPLESKISRARMNTTDYKVQRELPKF